MNGFGNWPTRNFLTSTVVTMALLVFSNPSFANEDGFSAPTTIPEKALQSILAWQMQEFQKPNSGLLDFLTQRPRRNLGKDKYYGTRFTKEFIRSVNAEDLQVASTCPGESCGLDYDPVLCAQDVLLPPYSYFTTRMEGTHKNWPASSDATARSAFILFRSGSEENGYRVDYLLQKEGGVWKIAGVNCVSVRAKFNLK
jgi:hypothetical protein